MSHPDPWGADSAGEPLLMFGALRGYRLMTVVRASSQPAYLSLRGGWATWPQARLSAQCLVAGENRPIAAFGCPASPGEDCRCGIYNAYHPSGFGAVDWTSYHWLAVTANWGKVIMGPRGFRSAQARLVAVAPRSGSIEHWSQTQLGPHTAPWRQQLNYLKSLRLDIQPTLAALIRAYPPDYDRPIVDLPAAHAEVP